MKAKTEDRLYDELVSSYEDGRVTTATFLQGLTENNLLERYVADFIEMVERDLPFINS
ncbi:MAG: hypothetical protein ACYDER_01255 [Ktedonobacteraceae bacterium]